MVEARILTTVAILAMNYVGFATAQVLLNDGVICSAVLRIYVYRHALLQVFTHILHQFPLNPE